MKEDVVAANLANLRQSINELKECVNRQNVTPNQPEQHIKVDLDEKTIYNGVAKSFCTCWNDALSVGVNDRIHCHFHYGFPKLLTYSSKNQGYLNTYIPTFVITISIALILRLIQKTY